MTWVRADISVRVVDGILMIIELDNEEIEKIINCVKYTMEQFCDGPMFIEYQMLIDSLEMQRGKFNQGGSVGQFMDWAQPPMKVDDIINMR